MEELSLSPRRYAIRETAAWRAPGPSRFDGRAANDQTIEEHVKAQLMPRWLLIVGGAAAAALIGAALGGAMAI
ncbi:hypothetical protein E4M02_09545 [Brevundimonas sp. S30B]|uniref:hypothetical protein n=1 Tax=unclassified Brevundimonas TaxID=2622653 RepID=UPI001071706F|nr:MULTISPECIES: hypothetical protein [unclassified Brevundimonas]QBX38586.1 hypothetical protein E4M01_12975 [Brevundimonas sp. MF30-B]TFW00464.1 hypothetical protein E4M02_14240 [Brevundimonas sp. S30B]TFW01889.1 hypothetical protein E4M02_09545 [Brevundimonas sp. S30B]